MHELYNTYLNIKTQVLTPAQVKTFKKHIELLSDDNKKMVFLLMCYYAIYDGKNIIEHKPLPKNEVMKKIKMYYSKKGENIELKINQLPPKMLFMLYKFSETVVCDEGEMILTLK